MGIISEILHPTLELAQATPFDVLHGCNTLKTNLILQIIVILIPMLLWLFYGFGTGGTRKIRLSRPAYWITFMLLLLQVLIFIAMDFPIWLRLFN